MYLVHDLSWCWCTKTLDVIIMYFFVIADITPEELFNMFFGGFGGISGGKKKNVSLIK